MIRYRWRYEVVPVMERLVEKDLPVEPVMERLTHLPAGFIGFVNNLGNDLQAFFRHGACRPAAGVHDSVERRPAPGTSDLGEKPVLYGVELGAVRRVVHDKYLHSDAVGEIHEILLDDTMAAGIGPTTVAEDDNHIGARIELLEAAVPHALDVVADKLGCVVAGAYREIARVACDVVDTVRHYGPLGESLKVVVVNLGRGRAVNLPVTPEVADHLLLLGVNAEDGYSGLNASRFCSPNLLELGVPVLHLAQRQALAERPTLESCGREHPSDDMTGHVKSSLEELATDLRYAEACPDDILVLRKPRHVTGDNLLESGHPLGMLLDFLLRTTARHALPAIWRGNVVGYFINGLGNGIRRTAKSLGHSLYRAAVGARCLACNKMPSVAFFKGGKVIHFHLANLYWRFLLHRCNDLEINYKDTKISPVILYLKC